MYCDLKIATQIQAMVDQVVDHFGHLDILINNARAIVGRDRVSVTELSQEVWDHFLAVNTTAVFILTKLAGRQMIRQGAGGRIINIASRAGKQASVNSAAYSASKFALIGLTQASALDLASHSITVNAVCPGHINSDRLSYEERGTADHLGITLEEFQNQVAEKAANATPLGRNAESEDVANLVAFLAGEEASFITGQAYNVNGGVLFH
jgi:NAD(P)-dependent dehydrogenase (short-subunit alcohol dehydrogenase family)